MIKIVLAERLKGFYHTRQPGILPISLLDWVNGFFNQIAHPAFYKYFQRPCPTYTVQSKPTLLIRICCLRLCL